MMFDPLYMMMILPGVVLALLATFVTKTTFAKYSRVATSSGLSGSEAARQLLDSQGLSNVPIEMTQGFLTDHYDPRTRTLNLSPEVYRSPSLSAVGVACHEAGHALQHAKHYAPLALRSSLVPAAQFGSNLALPIFFVGLIFGLPFLVKAGILVFGLTVLFTLITLPVEWNASSRAKRLMVESGIVTSREQPAAAAVLNAAFLTYIASAVTAILTLLYYLMRAGLLGRRND
jgi:Zn-dependent membrane protease YugP